MAKEAWDAVKPATIKNCWRHSGIQADSEAPSTHPTHANPEAWNIIRKFAHEDTYDSSKCGSYFAGPPG